MLKQAFLIFTIAACALGLGAQRGLFDLEYGDSRADTVQKLERQGFNPVVAAPGPEPSGLSGVHSQLLMEPADETLISGIELRFGAETDSLKGWSIAYNFFDEEDMGELVIGALISRHGTSFSKSADNIYNWDLGVGKIVVAGWDYFQELFVVDYREVADQRQ